ncbi:hypothetical protein BJ322DRAFT_333992 [Thelephora terrestris]|uniref:Transmembrane protein n=1 Tax=Thelephora terrestris TaxID=56493 RepID=A0A9P6H680_9AGAM|nr:hypothetical protein BJ322DRAFT_333992 [Thelephora terrestris]
MRFSTIFTVLAAGAMAIAGAVPEIVAKRSTNDIQSAFTTLSNKCDTILPKFTSCSDNDCTTTVVAELVVAIEACTAVVKGCDGGVPSAALVEVVVEVVVKIVAALSAHVDVCIGCDGLIDIYASVNVALAACLAVVVELCAGLAALLSIAVGLLGVVSALISLDFTAVLSVCLL